MTTTAYIGLGSNLGDGKTILREGWLRLGERDAIHLQAISSPYITAPVDMTSQHWFTNAVGRLQTTLPPRQLLEIMLAVETEFGRKREPQGFGYQDRTLDLDLLYYGDLEMDSPELTLPHPRIGDRLFVLVPLAELEPGFVDPVTGRSLAEMEMYLRKRLQERGNKQEMIHGNWNGSGP